MKIALWTIGIMLVIMIIVFILGPRPVSPKVITALPAVAADLVALEESIRIAEQAVPNLKPDNEARIIWFDGSPQKTEYSIVYLPGFTASWAEGEPIHRDFARRYGCNLYLPRLYYHGLNDDDAMLNYAADSVVASAAHALAIGRQIGEKVVLMSTSTGGTLSLILAADHPEIAALITYSPNIAVANLAAPLLNGPWGLQLARYVYDGDYSSYEAPEDYRQYWYTKYRIEALIELQNLIEHTMLPETFARVTQPFFMGYYYKNEEEQDLVVSVPAMKEMFRKLGTPEHLKREVAFPNVGHHVVGSYLTSKDLEGVAQATYAFAEEVLGWEPVN